MDCETFTKMLEEEYAIADFTDHDEILQYIAEMDGTGASPATLDAMQKKFHSCFLGSDEAETFTSEAPSEPEIAAELPLSEDA